MLLALLGAPRPAAADLFSRAVDSVVAQVAPTAQPGGASADDLTAWAGPARSTTLPELLQHAVRHSPSLANAKLDLEIAEARIYQTHARDDWRVNALLTANSSQTYFSGISFDRATTVRLAVDVSRTLPTGGTLTLHAANEYQRSPSFDPTDTDTVTNWATEVTATIAHSLLRGRGRLLYDANERKATLSRDAAVLGRRSAAMLAVQQVVLAYWDLLLAERQLAITRQSLDLAKERLRITQIGAEGGKIPRSEIPAVQQIIATREEQVLADELLALDRSLTLRRAAGMPIGRGELGLRVGEELVPKDQTWDLGQLTERSFQASPDLAQLAKSDAAATIDIEVTENGLLPQLDAALTIGPTGQDPSYATAWENTVKFKSVQIGGQLVFQHSFGQENIKGLAREIRANRRKLAVNAADLRAVIAQSVARGVALGESARRRVALSQRAIDLAKENIKIETDRFNLGKSTNFDVLNRQEELRQAELRKAQAIIDWHKAEVTLQTFTGDILPTYGVTVD